MTATMQLLTQVGFAAILVVYFAVIAAAGISVLWFLYHRIRDHWTLAQAWQEAQLRLFHHQLRR